MKVGLCGAVLVVIAASGAGCSTQPYCEALGNCGGNVLAGARDFTGTGVPATEWVANATNACVDQVPSPPSPTSLLYIPPRPAGIRAVEPTTIDWCSGLVIKPTDGTIAAFDDGWFEILTKYDGWFPSIPLYSANLIVSQNNQYTLSLTQLARQRAQFSQACLVAEGVLLTCDRVNTQLQAFVAKRLNGISGLTASVYRSACTASDGGCDCDYDVSLTTQVSGPWAVSGSTLTFFDAKAAPPAPADYCAIGGLELTGQNGIDLFNRNALKTLQFHAPTCTDGVMSKSLGETGIDCGGSCPNACPQ